MRDIDEFDAVIVGSGAGGGTVAKELAPLCARGLKVAVLEWGPRFKDSDFTGREVEMARRLYFEGGAVLNGDKTMSIAAAKAYGGSTVVYTGTSLKLPRASFERWGLPDLGYDDLMRRSEKYLAENNAHLLEPELINENNRLFTEGCRRLGWKAEQFPVNVKGCRGGSLCNLGCGHGAKQGTNRVQLPKAESTGVVVITGCRVERVEENAVVASIGSAAEGSTWPPGRYRFRAATVVLAAGALHTPALLDASGFGERLPALGRWFTCQPASVLIAEHPRPITNCWGHPKSFYCDQFAESKRFLLETCMYYPFMAAKSIPGFGPEHENAMDRMDQLQMILALAIDDALPEHRVRADRWGDPVVDYRLTPAVLNALTEAMRASARIFFEAGAERVHVPAAQGPLKGYDAARIDDLVRPEFLLPGKASISAAHLMGGCRMGSDPATSVTDLWGQVHGAPWLFVADASLFPKAAEINPYITIMALADRVAEQILRTHESKTAAAR